MTSHFLEKIPDKTWLVLNTQILNKFKLSKTLINDIFRKGYKNIYLSSSINTNKFFKSYYDDIRLLNVNEVFFNIVMVDSLNPCDPDMLSLFKSKIKIIGGEYNYINTSDYLACKDLCNQTNKEKIIKIYSEFPMTNHFDSQWNHMDRILDILNLPRPPSPKEIELMKLKKERDSSVFGPIIEILNKYSVNNWCCINSPYRPDKIKQDVFEKKYNYLARNYINEHILCYKFEGKEYIGGKIVKPIEPFLRWEFQNFFGFLPRCVDFDKNKTRYFYQNKITLSKSDNDIYKLLEPYKTHNWDKNFLKFVIWISINYLGILNSHKEYNCIKEITEVMNLEKLSLEEINDLIFPIPTI